MAAVRPRAVADIRKEVTHDAVPPSDAVPLMDAVPLSAATQAAARVLRRIGSTRPRPLSASHMTLPAAPGV